MNPSFEKLLSLVKYEDKCIFSKTKYKYNYKNISNNDIFITSKGVQTMIYYKKKFDIINYIEKYYKKFNIKRNYIISNYKIDLYFIDYNIGINCDDYESYDQYKKHNYLKIALDDKYINFNHESEFFNLDNLINDINLLIQK
ncbi:ORF MSV028 hypothetical protein [Melanoplus sanguinipes entomopoxvirus]|uniref:Uncharacterized protein n=1 Tax=Melanoplus sanguinipes entomopoxvirus TaxID=83191 RepID=Q9YW64_MSEPV|nr:ORF MSV028 hypothetical protein [Melanoplus sanguinipes entomopoxvirus]AAC97844.1 ORF MSV028 hypothetical protein [Melanoplus sanguinipes entomopoxvirus 'O']